MSSPVALGWGTQIPKRLANHEYQSITPWAMSKETTASCVQSLEQEGRNNNKAASPLELGSTEASFAPIGPCHSSSMIKRPPPSLSPPLLPSSLLPNHILLQPERNRVPKQRSLEAAAKVATLYSSVSPVSATGTPQTPESGVGAGKVLKQPLPHRRWTRTMLLLSSWMLCQKLLSRCFAAARETFMQVGSTGPNRCRSHVGTFQNDAWVGLEQSRGPPQMASGRREAKLSHTRVISPHNKSAAGEVVRRRRRCKRGADAVDTPSDSTPTGSTRAELFPWSDPIKPDVASQAHEKVVPSVRGGANRCDGYEMRHRFA